LSAEGEFDPDAVLSLVWNFCSGRRVATNTRLTVVSGFEEALRILHLKGPDLRWRKIHTMADITDIPASSGSLAPQDVDRAVHQQLLSAAAGTTPSSAARGPRWHLSYIVTSVAYWARLSQYLRLAQQHGLGWILPANRELLLVPRPTLRFAPDRTGILHDDSGRRAVEWPDGRGYFFLQGTAFDELSYFAVLDSRWSLQEIAALDNADRRSIGLGYLNFRRLVDEAGAELLDRGEKGTTLYRLALPAAIARDRPPGYGPYHYFIHMRDASHPEREFIEWVDPRVARHRDAELCQAHAFGISRTEWLSIEQEG